MNSYKKYLIVFFVIPLFAFSAHKYYISFTKIEYSEKSKSLQIISRIFIDDLQDALEQHFRIKAELDTDKEIENSDQYISKYISDKFNIKVNGKEVPYTYLTKKYDGDEVKVYIEVQNIEEIKSIEIQNKILMELFEDQQNIVKLSLNGKKKSFILTSNNDKDMLKF